MTQRNTDGQAVCRGPERKALAANADGAGDGGSHQASVEHEAPFPNGQHLSEGVTGEIPLPIAQDVEDACTDQAAHQQPGEDDVLDGLRIQAHGPTPATGDPRASQEPQGYQQAKGVELEAAEFEEDRFQ